MLLDPDLLQKWMHALCSCENSPGCFGCPEYVSLPDSQVMFEVYGTDQIVIPVAVNYHKKWGFLSKKIAASLPINGILAHPCKENASEAIKIISKISKTSSFLIQISQSWNDLLKESLSSMGFRLEETPSVHIIDLRGSYEEWFGRKSVQRAEIRKGEKNKLVVEKKQSDGIDDFYLLYQISHSRWRDQGSESPLLSKERFEKLLSSGSNRHSIYVVYNHDHSAPIAAAIIGVIGKSGTYLYGATDVAYGLLRPSNYLHARIIQELIDQGATSYIMGMSGGNSKTESFKKHLGANAFPVFIYSNNRRTAGVHLSLFQENNQAVS